MHICNNMNILMLISAGALQPQPGDAANNIMSDENWKYLMCPNDISSLADLLREKSDEYDLKGYMDVLTKSEAKQLTTAVLNEVTTVKGFNDTLTVDEAIKDKAIWNELERLQKIVDLTRGEFLELAKIAQESGVIDEESCKKCFKVFFQQS